MKHPLTPKRSSLLKRYASFAHLINDLCQTAGSVTAVHDKTGVDGATLSKYLHRRSKFPEPAMVKLIADSFPFLGDASCIYELVTRDIQRELRGESIPKPDLSWIRRGPKPGKAKRLRRMLGVAAACLALHGWGTATAQPLPVAVFSDASLDGLRLIGSWRRRLWHWLTDRRADLTLWGWREAGNWPGVRTDVPMA